MYKESKKEFPQLFPNSEWNGYCWAVKNTEGKKNFFSLICKDDCPSPLYGNIWGSYKKKIWCDDETLTVEPRIEGITLYII